MSGLDRVFIVLTTSSYRKVYVKSVHKTKQDAVELILSCLGYAEEHCDVNGIMSETLINEFMDKFDDVDKFYGMIYEEQYVIVEQLFEE